ncbi:hypothetical protein LINPERHAP1_LOCUS22005 [Linum perenne]
MEASMASIPRLVFDGNFTTIDYSSF